MKATQQDREERCQTLNHFYTVLMLMARSKQRMDTNHTKTLQSWFQGELKIVEMIVCEAINFCKMVMYILLLQF